jgi:anti-anti-sigma regulatory factor
MTLKIQRKAADRFVVFTLSGRIQVDYVTELQNLVDFAAAKNSVVLDLTEVRLVDREAVQFLTRCETEGVELDNCPAYSREWIEKERTP